MSVQKEKFTRFLFLLFGLFIVTTTVGVTAAAAGSYTYENDVLGISLDYPMGYQIIEHQYLSDAYGFSVVDSEKNPVFDVAWINESSSKQQNQLIGNTIANFPTIPIERTSIRIGGQFGTMLAPVPGIVANTLIYVSANERIYTLRYYKESLDDFGWAFVKSVRFYPARQSLDDLKLIHADDVLYIPSELENELMPNTPEKLPLSELSDFEKAPPDALIQSIASGCTTFSSVQTQWGSGANDNGWSWAGPSFWGAGSHVDCDSNTSYNDYYALDHALDEWDVIYPHKSGTVIFSGWAGGGWSTLGRMVIIDYGSGYWGVMAHLRSISSQAAVGNQVTQSTVIGYAGGSGNNADNYWGIHLHQSVNKDAKLSTNPGGIYDGQSARPSAYEYSGNGGGVYWNWDMSSGKSMSY